MVTFKYGICLNCQEDTFFKLILICFLLIGDYDWASSIHALLEVPQACKGSYAFLYCLLQDIASKILLFAQQRPRALCIMSAHGTVSAVTLTQPESSQDSVTYEVKLRNTYPLDHLCKE